MFLSLIVKIVQGLFFGRVASWLKNRPANRMAVASASSGLLLFTRILGSRENSDFLAR